MPYIQPEQIKVNGFEFSETLARKMKKNSYCNKIIKAVYRFGVVQFNIDDSPEHAETLKLLGEDTSYWVVCSRNEHNYYVIRYDIVEVTPKGDLK